MLASDSSGTIESSGTNQPVLLEHPSPAVATAMFAMFFSRFFTALSVCASPNVPALFRAPALF